MACVPISFSNIPEVASVPIPRTTRNIVELKGKAEEPHKDLHCVKTVFYINFSDLVSLLMNPSSLTTLETQHFLQMTNVNEQFGLVPCDKR